MGLWAGLRGKVEIRMIELPSLKGNPLRDPYKREAVVYIPPGHERGKRALPVIIALAGFLGKSSSFLNTDPFGKNLIEQADALITKGIPPFILAIPDGFTRYGGSQYRNSSATGRYEDMVVKDFVVWIQKTYPVTRKFGLMGKSSGGYGALMLGMKHPEIFSAIACHSGDLYFQWCYLREFPQAAAVLARYGSVQKFLALIWKKKKPSSGDITALNAAAMSACYSPNPKSKLGFDLPFDLQTAQLREDIWKKWLTHDPVSMISKHAGALRKMNLLYLDCGNQDEYFLHFGARIFTEKLKALRIAHVYEEFPDGHRNTAYRYSESLPRLAKALRS